MLLLDTCVLYWLASDQSKLSARAGEFLRSHASSLCASAISGFEVAINHTKGRVVLPSDPQVWFGTLLGRYRIDCLPVTWEIAISSVALPRIHSDPADRIIVATAKLFGIEVLTPDHLIAAYPTIQVVW